MSYSSQQINAIQSYMRENARLQYESVSFPPFTLFFHPTSNFPNFSYAIPDTPVSGNQVAVLQQIRESFERRGRKPRFEFLEAFAPDLPAALTAAGFIETERQWSMICSWQTLRAPPAVEGLSIIPLSVESAFADIRDFLLVQQEGFDPSSQAVPGEAAVQQARIDFLNGGWQPYLARAGGEPAACAVAARIIGGVTELTGIATRPSFRRRGIAAFLTWYATSEAFHQAADIACLTAADEGAGRVYERAGFQPFTTMLTYS